MPILIRIVQVFMSKYTSRYIHFFSRVSNAALWSCQSTITHSNMVCILLVFVSLITTLYFLKHKFTTPLCCALCINTNIYTHAHVSNGLFHSCKFLSQDTAQLKAILEDNFWNTPQWDQTLYVAFYLLPILVWIEWVTNSWIIATNGWCSYISCSWMPFV